MVDLAALSIVRDIVTILGVVGGFTYYVLNVRNAQKVRKAQTLQQFVNVYTSGDNYNTFMQLMNASWTDLEDFYSRYNMKNNSEFTTNRYRIFQALNVQGMMLREGVMDRKLMYDYAGRGFIDLWEKYSEVIYADRERLYNGDPSNLGAFEYLYNELIKERDSRGVTW